MADQGQPNLQRTRNLSWPSLNPEDTTVTAPTTANYWKETIPSTDQVSREVANIMQLAMGNSKEASDNDRRTEEIINKPNPVSTILKKNNPNRTRTGSTPEKHTASCTER